MTGSGGPAGRLSPPGDQASDGRFAGSARSVAAVPRLALSVEEACAALGCSWDFWREHIAPELRVVRRGRRKLVAVRELERWLERAAEGLLE
jgi:hypothetical protein